MARRLIGSRVTWLMAWCVGLMIVAGLATGGTLALWTDSSPITMPSVGYGHIGLDVRLDGVETALASGETAVEVRLGPSEAQDLVSQGELYLQLEVEASTQGHLGMDYTIEIETAQAGTVFAGSLVEIYSIEDEFQCTAQGIATGTLVESPISAIEPTYDTYKTDAQWFCLVVVFDPATGEPYDTTATATGLGPGSNQVTDTDDWDAIVQPDPASEPELAITITPQLTWPAELS